MPACSRTVLYSIRTRSSSALRISGSEMASRWGQSLLMWPKKLSMGAWSGGGAGAAQVLGDRAQRHERLGCVRGHGCAVVGDRQQDGDLVGVGELAGVEAVLDAADEVLGLESVEEHHLGLGRGLLG